MPVASLVGFKVLGLLPSEVQVEGVGNLSQGFRVGESLFGFRCFEHRPCSFASGIQDVQRPELP